MSKHDKDEFDELSSVESLEEIQAEELDAVNSAFIEKVDDTRPLLKVRRVSELTPSDKPLTPLPIDTQSDVYYTSGFEPRCVLCRSPWRERAEHWYLEHQLKPNSVVNFFIKYFNAQISWECVKTHMDAHCQFQFIGNSGLRALVAREDDMAQWRFRELDLAITGILTEIDIIGGIQCKGKPDLQMRRSAQLERLYSKLVDFKKSRDEAASGLKVDVFSVLMDVYAAMSDEISKKILLDKVKTLREKLA